MNLPASPIKTFATNWKDMSLDGKRRFLVESGQARDWSQASSLLAKHGKAVRLRRKMRKAERATTPERQEKLIGEIVGMVDSVAVSPECERCKRTVYTLTQHGDGRREQKVLLSHGTVRQQLLCLDCITAMVDAGEAQEADVHERRAA